MKDEREKRADLSILHTSTTKLQARSDRSVPSIARDGMARWRPLAGLMTRLADDALPLGPFKPFRPPSRRYAACSYIGASQKGSARRRAARPRRAERRMRQAASVSRRLVDGRATGCTLRRYLHRTRQRPARPVPALRTKPRDQSQRWARASRPERIRWLDATALAHL